MINEVDTIAAISTALGEGAIGIVRVSGPDAITICDHIVRLVHHQSLSAVKSHTINYGKVVSNDLGQDIDEVMVSVMRAPKTFTREDVIEINCHGGNQAVKRILENLLDAGARLAEPGEFTKRAFLNGRIDLSQAEAVMDLIKAKSDRAMDLAMGQLSGRLSSKIKDLRQEMLQTLAQVEVTIDYPEYDDAEDISLTALSHTAKHIKERIAELLKQSRQGRIIRDGMKTAIIGRPNVGKSSLLNNLIQEEKAIVTEVAGTTRDTIEETITINGIPLELVDTAGIRETTDVVEQIGVARSRKALEEADLVLLLLNRSEPLSESDKALIAATADKKRLILLNKTDLTQQLDRVQLESLLVTTDQVIETSMLEQVGIDALEKSIMDLFMDGKIAERDATYISNVRHIDLLKKADKCLDEVLNACEQQVPVDLIQIDFTRAWDLLGEITGESVQDELLTQLFSQFCLGK